MINGIAINKMCKGLLKIISPWKEKMIIRVRSNPTIVVLSNFFKKNHFQNTLYPYIL